MRVGAILAQARFDGFAQPAHFARHMGHGGVGLD